MSKGRGKPVRNRRRIGGWLCTLAAFLLLALLGVSDWWVHHPLDWQWSFKNRVPERGLERFIALGNWTANVTDNLGWTGRDCEVAAAGLSLDTNLLACAGLPRAKPGGVAPKDIKVLRRNGFVVGWSPSLRHPVWVAYRTFPAPPYDPNVKRPGFRADPQAERSPKSEAYRNTGFDRGHLAPNLAIARRYGKDGQRDSFLTSNICPQTPQLNQGPWYELEYRISEVWPDIYGSVWTIVGAIPSPAGKRLPDGVDIPTGFYQIVLAQTSGGIKAWAVIIPQRVRRYDYARQRLVSIDELESATGLDFLSELPDDVENALESQTATRLWPSGLGALWRVIRERYRRY